MELKEETKNILMEKKITVYNIDSERYGFNIGDADYMAITEIDLKTVSKMYGDTHVYGEVTYCKTDSGFEVRFCTMINDSANETLSGVFTCETDFLELFSSADKVNYDSVVEWLKNNRSEIASVLSDADVELEELPECLIDDVKDSTVDSWFENADYDDIYNKVPSNEERELAIRIIENL